MVSRTRAAERFSKRQSMVRKSFTDAAPVEKGAHIAKFFLPKVRQFCLANSNSEAISLATAWSVSVLVALVSQYKGKFVVLLKQGAVAGSERLYVR